MKKYLLFFFVLLPFLGKATNDTANSTGNWNATGTWKTGIVPASGDNVIILNGVTVTVNANETIVGITIESGGSLVMGSGITLTVKGNISNSGSFTQGISTSTVLFNGSSNQNIVGSPTATTTIYTLTINTTDTVFSTIPITIEKTLSITQGVLCYDATITGGGSGTLSLSSGTSLLIDTKGSFNNMSFPSGFTTVSLTSSSTVDYQSNSTNQIVSTSPTYSNLTLSATNPIAGKSFSSGTLTVHGNLLVSSCTLTVPASSTINLTGNATLLSGTLAYSSTGNFNIGGNFTNDGTLTPGSCTTTFNGSSAQTIGGSTPTAFYNLTVNDGNTVTLGNSDTVKNAFTISSGTTFDVSAFNFGLTVDGNFTDNGTFNCHSGTVTMGGSANQTITPPGGGITFNTLTINATSATDTVYPAGTITLSGLTITEGAFGTQTNTITASGSLSMASGTTLLVGSKSSTTAISLPGFSSTSLNSASTVIYQTNGSSTQTVATTPVYGNLILSSEATGGLKTASSSVTVAGNLTIGSSTTFSVTGTALTLGGNLTDNGTYSGGSGTVVFNGSATQTIGGSSAITFNNMTISGSGSGVVKLGYNTTVSNNLRLLSDTLDATSSNYNLYVEGNFIDSGGIFKPRNDSVSMTSTSSPKLGGSTTLQLHKLTIGNGGATNLSLIGNVTATSNITISGSATLNASSYNINIAGNFTDDGTFNCNTGTVDFDNSGNQCVSGSHTSETFQNLTVGPLSKLGTSCTINIDGTIFIQPGGQMLCACH